MKFKSITGTRDVLPEEQPYWRLIENKIYQITSLFGYQRVDPPIFEETALFVRGVGETTDIVEKEMYTFKDKSDNSLTLRPEFTAGVIRLYLQNGMHMLTKPVKVFSIGPIFRYERPQAGRFRQHTQFNVEAFGEKDAAIDFEVMSIAWHLYAELGFKGLRFQLNSTGCPVCRPQYIEKLQNHYRKHIHLICQDCKRRLQRNALRLLDCKVPDCQPVIQSAPVISEHLCQDCESHFAKLCHYLDLMERPYTINHKLVRGLDYYTKTVFEVWAQGIGAQNAMCGGGRYDGLIELLGGDPTPGIGFGSGIERIILVMKEQGLTPPPLEVPKIIIAHMGEAAKEMAINLTHQLRNARIPVQLSFGDRSLKSQLREANRLGMDHVIIIAEQEVADQTATIKRLSDGVQEAVPQNKIIAFFSDRVVAQS
ncbi:histidine--tRNA ligase [candidate division KSB1 bacterium]|nr:histidine--tRNA ligase [candidate division KSB1 bacterium]